MADEEERNRLLAEFTGVTDTDSKRAQFYLESSGWNLHIALSSFYDNMGEDNHNVVHEQAEESTYEQQSSYKTRQDVHTERKIASLASMRAPQDGSSEDEEGQAFYAGGSERSGQQILGPPRKKQPPDDVAQSIVEEAKRHGAEVVPGEDIAGPSVRQPPFKGAGYRLGDTGDSASSPVPETLSSSDNHRQQEKKEVSIKFWSNGFSVDDGPLRSFEDPNNEEFLSSVKRGEIPRELLTRTRRGEVHVNLEDNRHEEYVAPAQPKIKAFSGTGHKLGSPVPQVKFANTSPSKDSSVQNKPVSNLVDETQPITSIQIRLADGTRMVSKFNHTNTVGDIRRFICASRLQMAAQNFALMTTFPNKELTDDGQTIAEANLLNAVIVQRLNQSRDVENSQWK